MAKRAKRVEPTLEDQIRQAVMDSDLTRYRVAKDARVNSGQLYSWLGGHCGLSLDAADRICRLLDLRLVKRSEA